MFSLVSVCKSFGNHVALKDINLITPSSRTTALIGPSGCGKSTLFGLMTGLLKPDSGSISFGGEPITETRLPEIRRRIGYVIQDGGLFPHLTARENISIMARHLHWAGGRIRARVNELLALTRLPTEILHRYPAELSGGQRQRISLMRALMLDPEVLLLDEPLAALDPMVRADLQDDLQTIFHGLAKTVVIVTHDMNEAALLGDQVILMRAGQIVQTGTVNDLLDRPAEPFVSQFVKAQQSRIAMRVKS